MTTKASKNAGLEKELKSFQAEYLAHVNKSYKAANAWMKSLINSTPADHHFETFQAEDKEADRCMRQMKKLLKNF